MGSDWRTVEIKDLGRVITGRTPEESHPEYFGSEIPFITPSDMDGRRIIDKPARYLSGEGARALARVIIPRGVGVSCIGWQMGKSILIKENSVTNQQINTIIPDVQIVDDLFLFYVMSARRAEIFQLGAGGSRTPILNKSTFERLILQLPPLPEQRAIAHILGTLDDKIELNRRMNETLEAIARALFKSWFVDFDPVRAKAAGRQPAGMDAETAALFPDGFEESALGAIPRGWRVAQLADLADLNWGDTNTTKQSYTESGFIAFSASGPDGYLPYYDYDRTGVIVAAIGNNSGLTWLATGKWSCIKNTIRFWATDETISTEYLYYATLGKEKWPLRGSAQPFISQSDARSVKVLLPGNGLGRVFGNTISPYRGLITSLEKESYTLAAIRDALLPKLLSGEIRVKEAEKLVEAKL